MALGLVISSGEDTLNGEEDVQRQCNKLSKELKAHTCLLRNLLQPCKQPGSLLPVGTGLGVSIHWCPLLDAAPCYPLCFPIASALSLFSSRLDWCPEPFFLGVWLYPSHTHTHTITPMCLFLL